MFPILQVGKNILSALHSKMDKNLSLKTSAALKDFADMLGKTSIPIYVFKPAVAIMNLG